MGGTLVLPGQTVIPRGYGESMVLYSTEEVAAVVDGAPSGPNGRLYKVPAGKAIKVPFEAGRFLLEHLAYTGVVRVNEHETETGITYDVELAKKESLALLLQMDKARFDQYCNSCVEDYIANPRGSKPVPQPSPAIMAIIERRGWQDNLRARGIVPLGWEAPTEKDPEVEDLRNQLAQLRAQLADSKKGK